MKAIVTMKQYEGFRLPYIYNDVVDVVTARADAFMDAEELKAYSVRRNAKWTRIYTADGTTATFSAAEATVKIIK